MLEIIELKLVADAGTAANTLYKLMDSNDPVPQGAIKLEAAKTVLDRVGLGKKEQLQITHQGAVGLFVIPPKEGEEICVKDY